MSAPASALQRLGREAERVGGRVIALDPFALALSQYCLCGSRVKKPLAMRLHTCAACGLGPLDRDLFSAFLAYLCVSENVTDLSTGTLNGAGPGGRRSNSALPAERPCPPASAGGKPTLVGWLGKRASDPGARPAQAEASR
jgi:hypothetical protein